jgi:hypothetical protein
LQVLSPPLSSRHRAALLSASQVVLVRPGDVFAFSGGVAHTTLSVSKELNVAAYESLVTLHPAVVAHFLHTGEREGPFALETGGMEEDTLADLRTEVVRRLGDLARRLLEADKVRSGNVVARALAKRRRLEDANGHGVAQESSVVASLEGLTEVLSSPLRHATNRALQQLLAHAGFHALLKRDLSEGQLRTLLSGNHESTAQTRAGRNGTVK